MHQITIAQKARKQGAKIVVIDVHKNQTGLADWFIPIKPGTDSALALGIMHILFKENLHDEAFLSEYTVGYEELCEHVKQHDQKRYRRSPVSVPKIFTDWQKCTGKPPLLLSESETDPSITITAG